MKQMENLKNLNELMKNKDSFEKKLDKMHSDDLGLSLPKDYFAKSKNEILDRINSEKSSNIISLYKSKIFWFAAAGIALIIALSVFKPNFLPSTDPMPSIVSDTLEQIQNFNLANDGAIIEDDILVTSLFVAENQIDNYVDNYIVEESLIDEYIDSYLLDEMIDDTSVF